MPELFETPGWGLVFASWALAAAVGLLSVVATALVSLRGRSKRRRSGGRY